MDHTVTVIILCVLVMFSAYFSASETSFTSASKSKLAILEDKKNKRASLVLKMLDRYDRLLTTILIGNNIVNIAATAIATTFFIDLLGSEDLGSTVSTVVVTVVVLIFGEVCPKSLAKEFPEKFAMFSAPLLLFISWILYPLSILFSLLKKLMNLMIRNKGDRRVTDEELINIVEEACEEGGIDDQESELICSAIEFNDRSVSEIITPRIDVVAVSDDITLEELKNTFRECMFSRLPVYSESVDNVIGVVLEKECCYIEDGGAFSVKDYMKEPIFISEATKVGGALKTLQKQKAQMAVVIDEYGGTLGIVTVEDIIEELVGEIWDEYDEIEEDFIEIDENTYKVLGSLSITKLFRRFDTAEDEESEASTVSGWTIERLGRIPQSGDSFEYENIKLEVLEADPRRVESLIITFSSPAEAEE